jgi:hypothetical protein
MLRRSGHSKESSPLVLANVHRQKITDRITVLKQNDIADLMRANEFHARFVTSPPPNFVKFPELTLAAEVAVKVLFSGKASAFSLQSQISVLTIAHTDGSALAWTVSRKKDAPITETDYEGMRGITADCCVLRHHCAVPCRRIRISPRQRVSKPHASWTDCAEQHCLVPLHNNNHGPPHVLPHPWWHCDHCGCSSSITWRDSQG